MRKVLFIMSSLVFVLWVFNFVDLHLQGKDFYYGPRAAQAASSGTVTLTGTLIEFISLAFSTGALIDFGNITAGTPKCGQNPAGTVAGVTTSSANGYSLAINDGIAGADSAMLHSDGSTRIPDMNSGSIAVPVLWITGTHVGLGVTLFAADSNKEAAWGTGNSACDIEGNKYGGIPQNATTGHTASGYHTGADTSSWGWRVDASAIQKTGVYNGNVIFTSAALIN
jgi:hypothetical protein